MSVKCPRWTISWNKSVSSRDICVLTSQKIVFSWKSKIQILFLKSLNSRALARIDLNHSIFSQRRGYKYVQARRKGILTQGDQEKRLWLVHRDGTNGKRFRVLEVSFNFHHGSKNMTIRTINREYSSSLWTEEEIAFSRLDRVSFVPHRYNPADQSRAAKGRIWRKPEEGKNLMVGHI